jgi:hypothetical protein
MAKRRGDGRRKKRPNSPKIPAYKELVELMKSGSYYAKVYLIAKLKAAGYAVDETNISYVMTSARKHAHLCVYVPKQGYTSSPNGLESLVDIRKRRRISAAWLRNVVALVAYVRKNWSSLTASMKSEDATALKKELSYHAAAVSSNDDLKKKYGLV